jgi:hypothetical protein
MKILSLEYLLNFPINPASQFTTSTPQGDQMLWQPSFPHLHPPSHVSSSEILTLTMLGGVEVEPLTIRR